jgi:hypothetical protein
MPATGPEQMHGPLEQAFNAGDIEALMALYDPTRSWSRSPERSQKGPLPSASRCAGSWTARAGSRSTPSSFSASASSPTSRTAGR